MGPGPYGANSGYQDRFLDTRTGFWIPGPISGHQETASGYQKPVSGYLEPGPEKLVSATRTSFWIPETGFGLRHLRARARAHEQTPLYPGFQGLATLWSYLVDEIAL